MHSDYCRQIDGYLSFQEFAQSSQRAHQVLHCPAGILGDREEGRQLVLYTHKAGMPVVHDLVECKLGADSPVKDSPAAAPARKPQHSRQSANCFQNCGTFSG